MFSKEIYINRRNSLRNKIGSGLALFLGNDDSPMNFADNCYHFRQDSSFLYYFGLQHAGFAAIMDFDEGKDYIFGNDLTIDDVVWMGPQPTVKEMAHEVGVHHSGSMSDLMEMLRTARNKNRTVHFLPPYRAANKLKLFEWLDVHPNSAQSEASIDLIKAVVAQREVKSEEELVEIEKAVNTSVDMHVAAMKMVRAGIKEKDIANRVLEVAQKGAAGLSFATIATIHGETLHNHYHGNILKEGDLFLLDCGAETEMGYAGDLSSTMPVSHTFSDRQRSVYEVTLASHKAAVDMLKPGIPFMDVYYESARVIVDGMKSLGLMKGNTKDALVQGAHAMFFQCGLGHQMGLDVHDMEDLGEVYVGYDGQPKKTQFGVKSLRLGKQLKPGLVLTIEPGIYFIPALMDMWRAEGRFTDYINYDKLETYKDFGGIRNEENFVITEDGCRMLGKQKPKTIEEVEAIRSNPL
jgi:Xaa-Pro aminopeptidase